MDVEEMDTTSPDMPEPSAAHRPPMDKEYVLEHQLIKASFESYNRSYRSTQRLLEKEISAVLTTVNELGTKQSMSKDEAAKAADGLVQKLDVLKCKFDESKKAEDAQLARCSTRVSHLEALASSRTRPEEAAAWREARLNRLLIDCMLREGDYASALEYAKETGVLDFVEVELFKQSKKVLDSLLACSCTAALSWCAENRSRLKKIKSSLEFNLRLQEFLELVRKASLVEAITYSRKHFSQFAETNLKDIQQAMAVLAFATGQPAHPVGLAHYEHLFGPARWAELRAEFQRDNYALSGLASAALLPVALQLGLSALKTPYPTKPIAFPFILTRSRNCSHGPSETASQCPTCSSPFSQLAESLASAHFSRSYLICRLSGEVMDEHNPPMVLPNGMSYSTNALRSMAAKNHGLIVCPRTGLQFKLSECRKAFIL